jgi:hypothetical protein
MYLVRSCYCCVERSVEKKGSGREEEWERDFLYDSIGLKFHAVAFLPALSPKVEKNRKRTHNRKKVPFDLPAILCIYFIDVNNASFSSSIYIVFLVYALALVVPSVSFFASISCRLSVCLEGVYRKSSVDTN